MKLLTLAMQFNRQYVYFTELKLDICHVVQSSSHTERV